MLQIRVPYSKILSAVIFSVLPLGSQAGVVSLDFDSLPSDVYFTNIQTQGFRISPHCHVDIAPGGVAANFLGFDTSGCLSGNYNASYLGPTAADANVYIDNFGLSFDLIEFSYSGAQGFIKSSKGGYLEFGPDYISGFLQIQTSGDMWQGIQWIEVGGGCPGTPCIRLDNFVALVPEPTTNSLSILALLGLGLLLPHRTRLLLDEALKEQLY